MLRIKKLDIFIAKSFGWLFVGAFFICLFIFMMNFLWRHVDDLVGKGLEIHILVKFFYYSTLTLVPVALPLAILLASLMSFGHLGERYELLAMKSAGISLLRIMRPLMIVVLLLCGVSFFFQNVIGPMANRKLYTLLYSMRDASPELEIPEGVFYGELPGYNIRVDKKDRKTGMLYDVLIYDVKDGFDNARILNAKRGQMEVTSDKKFLWLHLFDGEMFENLRSRGNRLENVPFRTEAFREKHTLIAFDSDFNMADESVMNHSAVSKPLRMLEASIDSISARNDSIGRVYFQDMMNVYRTHQSHQDSVKAAAEPITAFKTDSIFQSATLQQKKNMLSTALARTEGLYSEWHMKSVAVDNNDYTIRRHKIEWHRKFTYAVTCLLFFFIGAPLGAIIRKGGLGMPVVMSIFLFLLYYVIENSGYKMTRDGRWIMFVGMWMSAFVLAVLGAFFTYKANKDSVVLNADTYLEGMKRIFGIRSVRHIFRKDVIINDPDYTTMTTRLSALSDRCDKYIKTYRLDKWPNYMHLWLIDHHDEDIIRINDQLELVVEELSNSRSKEVLNTLNNYPIISTSAHDKPFKWQWLNLLAGVCVPVGLFFYVRVWLFRKRLLKDLQQIVLTDHKMQKIISGLKGNINYGDDQVKYN